MTAVGHIHVGMATPLLEVTHRFRNQHPQHSYTVSLESYVASP
jgi:hypothetical protein